MRFRIRAVPVSPNVALPIHLEQETLRRSARKAEAHLSSIHVIAIRRMDAIARLMMDVVRHARIHVRHRCDLIAT